jgi:beta-lactamase superfamily II metal-dependent hydrolase
MVFRVHALKLIITITGLAQIGGAAEPVPSRSMEIYFIDVQGGAATLIVTPARESILVDSGWPGLEDRDPKRIVHALKDVAHCERLDHLVTTHWHRDHFGGVGGLANMVEIGHFWDRGLPGDPGVKPDFPDGPGPEDPLGKAYRAASAGKRTWLRAGDTLPITGAKVRVLASGGEVIDPAKAALSIEGISSSETNPLCANGPADLPVDSSDNARSLALHLSLGRFQFFDGGDLTWNVEKRLVCPVNLVGTIDLFQVTHHGMDISNHPTLVQSIAPVVAIMNNGPHKGGSPATVKLLKSVPSIQAAYQLHKNAATGVEDNTDAALIANKDASGGEFIQVRVAPDGLKFTVRIGEHGAERTFASH